MTEPLLEGFSDLRHVHLLGAGGAGVSGVGRILGARGVTVTGHDRAESDLLADLRAQGFVRARIDGEVCELDDPPKLDLRRKHNIDVVVDASRCATISRCGSQSRSRPR